MVDKHIFKPREDVPETCELCGHNFHNAVWHLTKDELDGEKS